jgi:hypothetical protein
LNFSQRQEINHYASRLGNKILATGQAAILHNYDYAFRLGHKQDNAEQYCIDQDQETATWEVAI